MIYQAEYISPFGNLLIGATETHLLYCDWSTRKNSRQFISDIIRRTNMDISTENSPIISYTGVQLDEYFEGGRRYFQLPMLFYGSDFQADVWHTVSTIPYGQAQTYNDIAIKSRHASAVRAVANAIGANRFSIIIPCHRVIGKNSIGGYAGGTDIKILLLEHELKNTKHHKD